MKHLLLVVITLAGLTVKADPFAKRETECFDPRAAIVQCPAGTVFKRWDKGTCEKGLVEGPECASQCLDPRVVFLQCAHGAEFKGWNQGTCEGGLVEGAICETSSK